MSNPLKAISNLSSVKYSSTGSIELHVDYKHLYNVISYLKYNCNTRFNMLIDITAIDSSPLVFEPNDTGRFQVVYHLLSLSNNIRLNVVCNVFEESSLKSVTGLYASANWLEREVWDLFGIYFNGHPDLRRILTDYGFQGHPLRKDFPLSGFVECIYSDSQKRILIQPTNLAQEFRSFKFSNAWDTM